MTDRYFHSYRMVWQIVNLRSIHVGFTFSMKPHAFGHVICSCVREIVNWSDEILMSLTGCEVGQKWRVNLFPWKLSGIGTIRGLTDTVGLILINKVVGLFRFNCSDAGFFY